MSAELDDALLRLHHALLAGAVEAPALLAEKLIPALKIRLGWLTGRSGDPHLVESAIGLSIAKYLKRPEVYDPSGRSLVNYLAMDVAGDVKNELRKRRTEAVSDAAVEQKLVELSDHDRNSPVEEEALDSVDPVDLPRVKVDMARRRLQQLSARDRELAELLVDGVRSYAIWADVLGIGHLPADVQKLEVKRQKDRIKKRLERMGDRDG